MAGFIQFIEFEATNIDCFGFNDHARPRSPRNLHFDS